MEEILKQIRLQQVKGLGTQFEYDFYQSLWGDGQGGTLPGCEVPERKVLECGKDTWVTQETDSVDE